MLVLTRKCREKIRIGDNIAITVFRIKGKAVRLGIEAPAKVTVLRGELAYDHETESVIEPEGDSFGATGTKQRTLYCSASKGKCWASDNSQDLIEAVTAHEAEPTVELVRVSRNKLIGSHRPS